MQIKEKTFGILSNGKKVKLYTLSAGDLKFSLTDFGATWTSLLLPSRNGGKDDVLLGYSALDGYLDNEPYIGVTVGRFANRIKDASFSINEKKFYLEANDGNNTLHSGNCGFDKRLWASEAYEEKEGVFVRFEIDSFDGDGGFPGNLKAVVTYGLTKSNEIIADYKATVDALCPVNITNHAYFNLAGERKGNILSHEVVLHCSSYVEVDRKNIPTGKLISVKGNTSAAGNFDFLKRRRIDFCNRKGYDHCFVVDGSVSVLQGEKEKLRPCAEVYEPDSGRVMKVFTTQPGVQFYTGNHLNNVKGKFGSRYVKHSGFCLETQHFPDTPNQSAFPQCVAGPKNDYNENSIFAFDLV